MKIDSELEAKLLPTVLEWLQTKNITCFKNDDGLQFFKVNDHRCEHPNSNFVLFFISDYDESNNFLNKYHCLVEKKFNDWACPCLAAHFNIALNNEVYKTLERVLWKALHQLPKQPSQYNFATMSSSINQSKNEILMFCSPGYSIRISRERTTMSKYTFNDGIRFYSHTSNSSNLINNDIINDIQYFLNNTIITTDRECKISIESYINDDRFPKYYFKGYQFLTEPFFDIFRNHSLQVDFYYLTLTWIVQSILLNDSQIALEIIGPYENARSFANALCELIHGTCEISDNNSVSEHNLDELAHRYHLVNLGNISEMSITMEKKVSSLLNGDYFELTHLKFPVSPKVFMRRPVIWTTKKSLPISKQLQDQTISVSLNSDFPGSVGMSNELHSEAIISLCYLLSYAMNIDHRYGQRTSAKVPDPLKNFDHLGNYLSFKYFGGDCISYTKFGMEMNSLLFESQSSHDSY